MRNKILRNSTLSVAFVLGACAGQSVDQTRGPAAGSDPSDPISKMEADVKLLATQCVFDKVAGKMTVTVATGETAILAMRSADKAVLVNGEVCNDGTTGGGTGARSDPQLTAYGSGTSNVLKRVDIVGDGGANTAMLDFTNGLFAAGANTAATGIYLDLKNDTTDTLVVKGTSGNDTVIAGAVGIELTASKKLDISFTTAVKKLYFSLGDGNDVFNGNGDTVAGGASNTVYVAPAAGGLQVFGGNGNDTINQGAAETKFEVVSGGAGIDTVDYSARTAAVAVSLGSTSTGVGVVVPHKANTSTAVMTVTGTATVPVDLKVKVTTAGANFAATPKIDISIDGGKTYAQTAVTAAATVAVTGTGLTVALADGTFVLGDTFTAARLADGGATELDDIQADVEVVTGGSGNDTLSGYKDNTLTQASGAYTLNGGAGDDWFFQGNYETAYANNATEVLNGGLGSDTVDYSNRSLGLVITMDGVAANDGDPTANAAAGEKDNVAKDIEDAIGGSAGDSITGNVSNNKLTGGMGSDLLTGGDGDDVFAMGAAKLYDGTADTISGGLGSDTVDYSARTDFGVTVTLDGATSSGATAQTEGDLVDAENAYGSLTVANKLIGNASANELVGGAGIDSLDGGAGEDVLDGGSGALIVDLFACGAGFDVVVDKNAGLNKASDFTAAATDCEIF